MPSRSPSYSTAPQSGVTRSYARNLPHFQSWSHRRNSYQKVKLPSAISFNLTVQTSSATATVSQATSSELLRNTSPQQSLSNYHKVLYFLQVTTYPDSGSVFTEMALSSQFKQFVQSSCVDCAVSKAKTSTTSHYTTLTASHSIIACSDLVLPCTWGSVSLFRLGSVRSG